MKAGKRWRAWLLGAIALLATAWGIHHALTHDDVAFLGRFKPRSTVAFEAIGDRTMRLLTYSKEDAPEVVRILKRELPARGFKRLLPDYESPSGDSLVHEASGTMIQYGIDNGGRKERLLKTPPERIGECYVHMSTKESWLHRLIKMTRDRLGLQ